MCVELETPEKASDNTDVVKLRGNVASTSQETRRVSKGSHSVKMKGKKRKIAYDSEEEEQDQPKLTSKQVCILTGHMLYSKTCLKRPLKKKTKNWFSRPIIA